MRRFGRRLGIDGQAGLLASGPDGARSPPSGSSSASRWKTTMSLPASANASTYCERPADHQVAVERQLRVRSHRVDHHRTHGDVAHEVAVHDVQVDRVHAAGIGAAHLLAQPGEVGVQDAGADLRWAAGSWRHDLGFASAPRRRGRQVASGQLRVELATGRLDLTAARVAHGDGDAGGAQHAGKGGDARRRRAAPARAGGRVQRDEVDVAPPAGCQRRQALGLLAGCRSCRRSSRTPGSPGGPSAPRTDALPRSAPPAATCGSAAPARSRSVSSAAWRLIARFTCGSSSIMRSMPGTTPEVLTVMCRAPIPSRSGSFSRRTASNTRSVLLSGSPMPMKTML